MIRPVHLLILPVAVLTSTPLSAAPAKAGKTAAPPARPAATKSKPSARPAPLAKPAGKPQQRFTSLRIEPKEVVLEGSRSQQRILVTGVLPDGQEVDVTSEARLAPSPLARVDSGRLRPLKDGNGTLAATLGTLKATATLQVTRSAEADPISFINDVMPVLSKSGCNGSACHGSPAGKGGLKLSLFGYEPALDHAELVKEAEGKRVDLKNPGASLLLQKSAGGVPHAGGSRFRRDSPEAAVLTHWLAEGARGVGDLEARLERLTVTPGERWLGRPGLTQPLLVTAHFSDGSLRDVSESAVYSVNDDSVARVDERGLLTGGDPGETAVMVRHLGQVGVCRVVVLSPNRAKTATQEPRTLLDRIVFNKLQRMGISPSAGVDDATFCRRVHLDICGIVPTAEEVRAFLADQAPDKRAQLIEKLLQRPDHADVWTLKWADTLRNNPQSTAGGAVPYHAWIREQLAANVPVDRFARSLLTASGVSYNAEEVVIVQKKQKRQPEAPPAGEVNPATNYFMVAENPLDLTSNTSQIFLGIRLECARCHNHPFERWTQEDYYGLAANFAGVQVKKVSRVAPGQVMPPAGPITEARPARRPAKNRENTSIVRHPRTNEIMAPRFLDGSEPAAGQADRRLSLAEWLTAPANPFFARNIVNRIWAHYFGRGIVEPVDDVRVTNPPSNPELLDALAAELVKNGYDTRHVHRLILNSGVYQLSSQQNETNAKDLANFSRYYPKRLSAEQLYDSVAQVTGASTIERGGRKGNPLRYQAGLGGEIRRAVQIPTPKAAGALGDFLTAFGRPEREVVCECERSSEGHIGQALIMLNGDVVNAGLAARDGRLRSMLQALPNDEEFVTESFLLALGRNPSPSEKTAAVQLIRSAASRDAGGQDLIWSLLNSREFLFNH